jgi:DNA-binding GntR family transcriptional regulator
MAKVNTMAKPDMAGAEGTDGIAALVFRQIRADILSLTLAPGEIVAERGLETRYGASRTPVREALGRLIADGLVERYGRGYRVTPLDAAQLRELFEFREDIEAVVVRKACRTATPEAIAALRTTVDRGLQGMTPEHWLSAGFDIHVELAALTGNRFLVEAVRTAVGRAIRPRWLLASDAEERARAHADHSEILALIAAGDADGAERAIRAHTRAVGASILAVIENARRFLGERSFADGREPLAPSAVKTGDGAGRTPSRPTDNREEPDV